VFLGERDQLLVDLGQRFGHLGQFREVAAPYRDP
jgi:hypothetical protein